MKRAFLIHGWDSNPGAHWLPWLRQELEQRGFSVTAPAMPLPALPTRASWTARLAELVGTPDAETFIIGHSLGCIATVRYIETLPEGSRLGGCIFVGGFSGNISIPELETFYEESAAIDFGKVRAICPRMAAIFSDNDEYVPIEKGSAFAEKLGAETIVLHGAGHFRSRDGFRELPAALDAVLRFSAAA
jgi:predicted alpha/beta hydrolase family esterase